MRRSPSSPSTGVAASIKRGLALGTALLLASFAASARASDESRASTLLGVVLYDHGGAALGGISDLLIDTEHNRIGFVALRSPGGSAPEFAVPWSAVNWAPTGAGKYVARLLDDAETQTPYDQAATVPFMVGFSTDLLGRPVRAGNGVIVGTAQDLRVAMPAGRVTDLLVAKKGKAGGKPDPTTPIPWCNVADLQVEHPIDITLDPAQIGKMPPCPASSSS